MKFDTSVDILVVGSGGGALTAALAAAVLGADVLVVEKDALFGGTTASSGGAIWVPCSHIARAAGFEDSREEALRYLIAAIGDSVSRGRLEAYVDSAPRMLKFLEDHSHVHFWPSPYSDYYPELPGAISSGIRSHEPVSMHARRLGADFRTLVPPYHILAVLGRYCVTNNDGHYLLTQAPGWQWVMFKMLARYWLDLPARWRGRRDARLTLGNALIGRLKWSLNDRKVPVWLSSPMRELIVEDGRICGAVIERDGSPFRVEARAGVIMGAGGFEQDATMRERYLPHPTSASWSATQPGNTGDAIRAGMALGAATALMNEAWWCPVIRAPDKAQPWALFAERSLPGQIIVNREGRRFSNEAAPYLEFGRSFYAGNAQDSPNIPAFIVFDANFRRKYPLGPLGPASVFPDEKLPRKWQGTVYFKDATLAGLAAQAGIDFQGLEDTIHRNNVYARTGIDDDFHRGAGAYDRHYGDATVKPNPCIAPILQPPFYAMVIYPGDIGTKGGLLTDEHARVLDGGGAPLPGLYAIGNTSASVMGTTYPGAGATIGPSMVFGYIAAHHALNKADRDR
jgi:3-oxosteroid 1-dehydrogenase